MKHVSKKVRQEVSEKPGSPCHHHFLTFATIFLTALVQDKPFKTQFWILTIPKGHAFENNVGTGQNAGYFSHNVFSNFSETKTISLTFHLLSAYDLNLTSLELLFDEELKT